ncbi:hypothetical protein PHYSODRAFT_299108 [Phytophthora sojae]|uniref:Uncharacterized protein n=1 Tax=Phytophthora sojae (strain P6497) TaxID=1094619 RepID=G4ZC64_PHYSP|nr:hypothetical protein PHYSODRAFT_299108 [Phytophthora sojae]EGZ21345.1 hypothetical protein PHYSODRAFT_299108 [Phytophthora sojae]|eukprot:XP_009524062.1 hypothetical protein PHYSODRAFT_299108 [Phytophthora sojae]
MEHDRVRLCRPQHLERSEKFTKALNEITAILTESLGHSGVAITIPLRVHFVDLGGSANDYVEALLVIKEAEREIETRWSNYVPKENEANQVVTFRFVPEPMVVGIRYADMTLELVNAVENLVFAGVCFTQFAENLGMDLEDAYASVEAT